MANSGAGATRSLPPRPRCPGPRKLDTVALGPAGVRALRGGQAQPTPSPRAQATLHALSSATCWVWHGAWRGLSSGLPAVCVRVWGRETWPQPPACPGMALLCLGQDKTLKSSLAFTTLMEEGSKGTPSGSEKASWSEGPFGWATQGQVSREPLAFSRGVLRVPSGVRCAGVCVCPAVVLLSAQS